MKEQPPEYRPPSVAVVSHEEFRQRVGALQENMARERLDAVFITSEDNFKYFTGFHSPVWVNLTRPRYCVIPSRGDPFIISATSNTVIVERTTWITDVRTWVAPNPLDDGISLLIDGLQSLSGTNGRIGAEEGPESRITMPVADYLRVKREIAPREIVDASSLIFAQRRIKSPAEAARIRAIAQIASASFEALPAAIERGDTIFAVCQKLKVNLLSHGADDTPYVIGVAGRGGYPCINLAPEQRALEQGEVLVIDTGSTSNGYFCDFDREFAIGEPSSQVKTAYRQVWNATEAGLGAIRPGRRTCDVWQAMANELGTSNASATGVGRMGHGLGLRMCEPPSVSSTDRTILEPGMVITLEPGIAFYVGDERTQKKVCIHEENVLVTANGVELLTRRAPRTMPVVAW